MGLDGGSYSWPNEHSHVQSPKLNSINVNLLPGAELKVQCTNGHCEGGAAANQPLVLVEEIVVLLKTKVYKFLVYNLDKPLYSTYLHPSTKIGNLISISF